MYEDSNDALRLDYPEDEDDEVGNVLLFLLSVTGGLHVSPNLRISDVLDVPHPLCN